MEAAISSWVLWTVESRSAPESRNRASRQGTGRKAMSSSCSDSRRTVRARYWSMDMASSGSRATAWVTTPRSMGTSSQGVRATAEDTRGSWSKKEASPKRLPAWYTLSTRSAPPSDWMKLFTRPFFK